MTNTIFSVDELCTALEQVLRDNLAATMSALGFEYDSVATWQQVPTTEALSSAKLPGVAIATPGLVSPPTFSRASGTLTATWRIAVGVYERGRDHNETQAKARNWCAGIRSTVLAHKSLGSKAKSLTWAGEEYALIPGRESARTIAAGAVAFDVTAEIPATIPIPDGGDLPTVLTTPTTLSVQ